MKQFKVKAGVVIGLVAGLVVGVVEAKEQRLVFSGYSGSTTLTDFQAMVKLTEGQYGFSYNDYAATTSGSPTGRGTSSPTKSTSGTPPAPRTSGCACRN